MSKVLDGIEKSYGYVPKAVLERIEECSTEREMIAAVDDFFDSLRKDMKSELEALDDEVAIYRGLAAKRAVAFKEATGEILKNAENLWEVWDSEMPSYYSKIKEVRAAIEGVNEDFDYIKRRVDSFDLRRLEDMLRIVREIDQMSEKNKDLLLALLASQEES